MSDQVRRDHAIYVEGRLREATSNELIEVSRGADVGTEDMEPRPSANRTMPRDLPASRFPESLDNETERQRDLPPRRLGLQTHNHQPGWDRRVGLLRD